MEQVRDGVADARRRIDHWRQNGGGKGIRMPETLWREAVELADSEGLYATARGLGLDYTRLKERATKTKGRATKKKGKAAVDGFVEAGFVEVALPTPQDSSAKAVVEFVGSRGRRMRIELNGALDLSGLMHAFWKSEE